MNMNIRTSLRMAQKLRKVMVVHIKRSDKMQQVISIGGFHIYIFGITIALGLLAGYFIANWEVKRKGLDEGIFSDLALIVIMFSIIGARLYYVFAFNLNFYLENPMDIFLLRNGGMSIQGGILGGVLSGGIYLAIKKAKFKDYADAFVPGLAFGQFIGRLGCDVFGIPMETPYPWGMLVRGQLVHPVQIYEALLDLMLFAFLWRRRANLKFKGQLFVEYLIGFGTIRALVEFFRVNPIWYGNLTVAHLTSFVMIGFGIFLYGVFRKQDIIPKKKYEQKKKVDTLMFYGYMLFLGAGATYLFYLIRG